MRTLLAVIAYTLQFSLISSATAGGDAWPHENDPNDYYWFQQQLMDSPEEAIGAIKNLQPYFVQFAGWTITSLDIDKYGLRASGTWSEAHARWVPSSGGFFAGNTYVPVYGGSTQTYSTTQQESFSISFNGIKSFFLIHYHTIDNPYKWGVMIVYKDSTPPASLRVRSKDEAKRLISAFETLAVKQGYDGSIGSVGLDPQPLTPEQSAELGLPNGIGMYCRLVFKEGPFEKVGLRPGDVIASIDDKEMHGHIGLSHARGGLKEWVAYRRESKSERHKKVILKINTDTDVIPVIKGDPRNPNKTNYGGANLAQEGEAYWFMPTRMASVEQAIGTIKNLQQDIVGHNEWRIDDLDVDIFGIRAKGKDAMVIIPFDEISRMAIEHSSENKSYAWGLWVTFATERQRILLRTTSDKIARRLGDAIGTLAIKQGVRVQAGAGVRLNDSTVENRKSVNLTGEYGVTISNVAVDGPAEKAGLKRNDIIIQVGGVQVAKRTDEVISTILKAEVEAKPLMFKVLRLDG